MAAVGEETVGYETILVARTGDGVATVTLNRPEAMNSFNQRMREEFAAVWAELNADDEVRAVVLQAADGRAFSTGIDVKQGLVHPENIWAKRDPGEMLGPKSNKVWKPVVCAVHGMAAGGAFYWITESDIVICSEEATFFDPHVSYGMVAALEPIGLSYRVGASHALRMALMGLDERVTASTALQIGLVTEVVARAELRARAHEIAATIAAKPTSAVQGTVRAFWESLDVGRSTALERGLAYATIGSPDGIRTVDRSTYVKPQPRLR
ncbi:MULTISPECIES: enoyl-CoA hydratase/isomerase family protein [Nocardia]|jgi:enoyl-CoA hydratase/carnithine racemase|uniref:enoyl-CoA hydratase/isomerase family protein n=1 Tax=Nocardia abscessus TaxID=120957 RepID=UPI0018930DEC|nr:enoyl-CoA hydratase/isomerase family protein [Nocardia abscessus]MBF6207418.1 enoyl-CoA hydratase/isomerase family protein [Streptomyces gardneri]MBF6472455.1 enoyl-CoA hydratase/isomerase family protein [Nocardia abscessus]